MFEEMPGSSLTLAHAARLFSLPLELCKRLLHFLVEAAAALQESSSTSGSRGCHSSSQRSILSRLLASLEAAEMAEF
jgi:hypothetical protein